jgi:dihydroxynaphthoic acid synthetase
MSEDLLSTGKEAYTDIRYAIVDDAIAHITIARPQRLNSFTTHTLNELITAFNVAADDSDVGVVVLSGEGNKAFSAGGELVGGFDPEEDRRFFRSALTLATTLRNLGKPIIAKIRGWCIGGGNELNMLCDLSLAAESAKFGQTGPKVGSVPVWYGIQGLLASVGEKRTREIVYLCRHYTAHEAEAMGWINKAVPDGELDDEVDRWCKELLAKGPASLALAKAAINALTDQMQSSVSIGAEAVQLLHATPEADEARRAFVEKRAPHLRSSLRHP